MPTKHISNSLAALLAVFYGHHAEENSSTLLLIRGFSGRDMVSCPDISLHGPAKIYICGTFYVSTAAGVYDFRQLQLRSAAGSSPKGLSSPTGCC